MSAPIVHRAPPEGGIRVINAAQPWGLRNLFSGTVQGAWCDPEAGNTQFQDAAATTHVTAVEQQLGARLDRSGWGNHATQAVTTKRPVYSRRVNLLQQTEKFNGSSWYASKTAGASASANTGVAPDGTMTANTVTFAASGDYLYQPILQFPAQSGSSVVLSYFSKVTARLVSFGGATPAGTDANSYLAIGGGWYVHKTVRTFTSSVAGTLQVIPSGLLAGSGSFELWGASLTHATDAHLPYQRVNTATDYDAAPEKFPAYLTANGTSHMMQSATGAGGTTGFYYCAPIRLLKLGAVQVLWSDATGDTGYEVRINASNQLELSAGTGAARVSVASAALVLGRTYILTAMHDGAALSVQVDSGAPVSAACGPIAAGTAGYTLFRAAGTDTGYANVREYGFVYTKNHCPSATHRAIAAQILAAKARITA